MLDRVDVIKVAISRMEDQLSALQKRMEATPHARRSEAGPGHEPRRRKTFVRSLTDYEQEMRRIQKDASDRDRLEKEIRIKYARSRPGVHDKQKVAYEPV